MWFDVNVVENEYFVHYSHYYLGAMAPDIRLTRGSTRSSVPSSVGPTPLPSSTR